MIRNHWPDQLARVLQFLWASTMTPNREQSASLRLASTITPMPADRSERAMRSRAVVAALCGLALAIANYVL